jgi:UDP-N-acetyl-D-mannosaminuronate dehydrogenase
VDDLRESPAIEVVRLLQEAEAEVRAFEPFKPEAQVDGVTTVTTLEEALEGADVLLLLVAHRQFLALEPEEIAEITPARMVVDAVNGWSPGGWEGAGFRMARLGDG